MITKGIQNKIVDAVKSEMKNISIETMSYFVVNDISFSWKINEEDNIKFSPDKIFIWRLPNNFTGLTSDYDIGVSGRLSVGDEEITLDRVLLIDFPFESQEELEFIQSIPTRFAMAVNGKRLYNAGL